MNTLMLISLSFLFLFNCVLSPGTVNSSDVVANDTEDIHLQHRINSVRYYLEGAQNRKIIHYLDWNKLGATVVHLYETDDDMQYLSEVTDWLIRYIPQDRWEAPETAIRQFLMDSQDKPDREEIRLKLLDLLLFRAPIPDFSTSKFTDYLFDPMPSIRRFMIQTLKEDGTTDAIPDLEKRIAELKSKPSPPESDLEEITLLKEAIENIRLWAERLETGWVPNEDEIQQQVDTIIRNRPHAFGSGYMPPGFMDGPDYIIDRWHKYKWGAELIIKSDEHWGARKAVVVRHILSRVHDGDWDEAFPIIMHYYNNSDSYVIRAGVMENIMRRNSVDDLHRLSYLLTSEDPADFAAMGALIRKYAEIGTEEHLPELRRRLEFWKKRDSPGRVCSSKRTIKAIEQRLGIAPAEDSDSSDTP